MYVQTKSCFILKSPLGFQQKTVLLCCGSLGVSFSLGRDVQYGCTEDVHLRTKWFIVVLNTRKEMLRY